MQINKASFFVLFFTFLVFGIDCNACEAIGIKQSEIEETVDSVDNKDDEDDEDDEEEISEKEESDNNVEIEVKEQIKNKFHIFLRSVGKNMKSYAKNFAEFLKKNRVLVLLTLINMMLSFFLVAIFSKKNNLENINFEMDKKEIFQEEIIKDTDSEKESTEQHKHKSDENSNNESASEKNTKAYKRYQKLVEVALAKRTVEKKSLEDHTEDGKESENSTVISNYGYLNNAYDLYKNLKEPFAEKLNNFYYIILDGMRKLGLKFYNQS